jgi:capsid protein
MARSRNQQQPSLGSSFLEARSEYAMMRESRFRRNRPGITSMPGSADTRYANEPKFIRSREYARAMIDDDAIMKTLVNRAVTNIHRSGFGYEPDTGDEQLNADLKEDFNEWANDPQRCDIAGTLSLWDIGRLTVFNEIVDGDVFHVGTQEGALQTYEAHRCASPSRTQRNIVHGVQLTEKRQRISYFFKREPPGTQLRYDLVRDFHETPAYDADQNPLVWHVFDPYRFTQTRGLTAFHPVFDKAGMLEDVDFALLVKQQASAMLVWEWNTKDGYTGAPAPAMGAQMVATGPGGTQTTYEEISSGSVLNAPPGKELNMHSSNIPSSEAMAHLRQCMQTLSLSLGLPLCVGLMDATETNFTGWRAAKDEAKLGFTVQQDRYERMFYRPVANFRIRQRLTDDDDFAKALRRALERGVKVFKHWWQKPRWPYIQPLQDANANAIRLQTGQVSLRDLHGEMDGGDFGQFVEDNVSDRGRWIRRAIVEFQKVVDEHPALAKDLTWRDFYHCDAYKGIQYIDTVEQPDDGSGQPTSPGKKK